MTLRLNGSTSGYTEIEAPAVAGSNTLVLPTGNGTANYPLVTDGSGVLSWSKVQPSALDSGLVLKVQQFFDVGSNSANTSYTNANAILFNYSPVSTLSTLIIISTFGAQINNVASTNTQSFHAIGESSVVIGNGYIHRSFSASGGNGLQSMGCIQVSLPNTSLSVRSFQMMHACNGAGQSVTTDKIYMTIMEVAQ